jgi:hypothetical protein
MVGRTRKRTASSKDYSTKMTSNSYVDLLVAEWGIEKHSQKLHGCVRRVLGELSAGVQLVLRKNPRLQVVVLPEAAFSVWAYFPVHRRRTVVRQLAIRLKPTARVLLVMSEKHVKKQSVRKTNAELRDHFGHVLVYLQSSRRPNECEDAWKEWQKSVHTNRN